MSQVETIYHEVNLSAVLQHWMESYEVPNKDKIITHDFFFDPIKEKVILKLIVNTDTPDPRNCNHDNLEEDWDAVDPDDQLRNVREGVGPNKDDYLLKDEK